MQVNSIRTSNCFCGWAWRIEKNLKLFFVILLILFGSFLIGLRVDNFGKTGNIIMNIIGFGCNLGAIFIARSKKENQQPS